jgi:hypothetical protein
VREHGTHARYVVDRCRCDRCRAATREYERKRRARIEPAYVAAGPARRHVEELRAAGVGLKQVAKAAGLPHGTLSKLIYGDSARGMAPSKRVRPATAERILAVTPADIADGARVPAGPTWEHVERLVAAGVPRVRIAERIGQTRALQLGRQWVQARHAREIAAMAAELAPVEPADLVDDRDRITLALVEMLEDRIDQAEWRAEAACQGRPTWMWFPARGDSATLRAAKRVCGACLVRDDCLTANLHQRDGVYGGLSARERRALRSTEEVAS